MFGILEKKLINANCQGSGGQNEGGEQAGRAETVVATKELFFLTL